MQKDVSDGDVAGLFLLVPPGCGDSLSAPSVKPGERLGVSEWSLFSLPHCFALPCRLHLNSTEENSPISRVLWDISGYGWWG